MRGCVGACGCACMCLCACVRACVCVCVRVCMCTYVHVYLCVKTYVPSCSYECTYVQCVSCGKLHTAHGWLVIRTYTVCIVWLHHVTSLNSPFIFVTLVPLPTGVQYEDNFM